MPLDLSDQVACAIRDTQPSADPAPPIVADIVTLWNPVESREELWPTAFHPLGISVGARCLNIVDAERVLAKIKRNPTAWIAERIGAVGK